MGGQETFANRLKLGIDREWVDYGNEPAFLAAALFNYTSPIFSRITFKMDNGRQFTIIANGGTIVYQMGPNPVNYVNR
ncbi:MAG: glycoside hydrolase family 92 protein [Treponema sp.]|jgi:putative alpha-1,2-mannosidase|nr:glycoside hydrolase family 92 protein [Treponema sp.]